MKYASALAALFIQVAAATALASEKSAPAVMPEEAVTAQPPKEDSTGALGWALVLVSGGGLISASAVHVRATQRRLLENTIAGLQHFREETRPIFRVRPERPEVEAAHEAVRAVENSLDAELARINEAETRVLNALGELEAVLLRRVT